MRVVIAIDSFKGSLGSMEAGHAIKAGILKAVADADVIVKPLADGGEGTTAALLSGLGGEMITVSVTDPLGRQVKAEYGIIQADQTAVIEMAAAAGLGLVEPGLRNPLIATTYGVGEMIKDAIKRGCRHFIIGIGGSATTDGGVGMLTALGYRFLDQSGAQIEPGIIGLGKLAEIRRDTVLPELEQCRFTIACDVNNPLYGENGAVYIYGKQKGVKAADRQRLDVMMQNYAQRTKALLGKDFAAYDGAGAAGGMGFACLSYLNAELRPGIEVVLTVTELEQYIQAADFVVTGEGRLDLQTAMGKAPIGVAKLAKKHGARVIAFAGALTDEAAHCNEAGIDAYFSIQTKAVTLEEAMEAATAKGNLTAVAEQIFRLIKSVK